MTSLNSAYSILMFSPRTRLLCSAQLHQQHGRHLSQLRQRRLPQQIHLRVCVPSWNWRIFLLWSALVSFRPPATSLTFPPEKQEEDPGVEVDYLWYILNGNSSNTTQRRATSQANDLIPTVVGLGRRSFMCAAPFPQNFLLCPHDFCRNQVTRRLIVFSDSDQPLSAPNGKVFAVPNEVSVTLRNPGNLEAVIDIKYHLFASLQNYLDNLFSWTANSLSSVVTPRTRPSSSFLYWWILSLPKVTSSSPPRPLMSSTTSSLPRAPPSALLTPKPNYLRHLISQIPDRFLIILCIQGRAQRPRQRFHP